jgi:hypothetical protein
VRAAVTASAQAKVVAPRAAAAAEDGDQCAVLADGLRGVGEALGQPVLGVREEDHLLGADLDRPLPDAGVVQVPPQQDDVRASRQPQPGAAVDGVGAHDHERRSAPRAAGGPAVGGDLELGSRRGRQAEQVVEHVRIGGDDEGASGHGGLRGNGAPPGAAPERQPTPAAPRAAAAARALWTSTGALDAAPTQGARPGPAGRRPGHADDPRRGGWRGSSR